jgi:hypothetical protein
MRHVAAYLLLALGGNENPTASEVTDLLSSVGIEPDQKSLQEPSRPIRQSRLVLAGVEFVKIALNLSQPFLTQLAI